jgi:hypothetical protein
LSHHSLLCAVPDARKKVRSNETAAIADLIRLVYRPHVAKSGRGPSNAQTFRWRDVPSRALRLQQ